MDQIAAKELAKETQLASLELGMEDPGFAGSTCDGGVTRAYLNTIAWRTPTTPLPIENNPRAVFERLFGASGSTDPAVRRARMRKDRSILDFVRDQAASLENVVGPQDQATLSPLLRRGDRNPSGTLVSHHRVEDLRAARRPCGSGRGVSGRR